MSGDHFGSAEAALGALKGRFAKEIAMARKVADEIIARTGTAHTGQVHDLMLERGMIIAGEKCHWLGCIFSVRSKYRRTGEKVQAVGHDGLANVWTFVTKEGANAESNT